MKQFRTIMAMASIAVLAACASNDVAMEEEQKDLEMAKEQAAADAARAKAEAEAKEAEMKARMEEEEMQKEEAAMETVVETAESADESSMSETSAAGSDADKLVSTCTYGDAVRIISVVYDNPETGTVCEVTYEKDTGIQTLWSAYNERDYCLPQAEAFVEKQQGWGWDCTALQ